MFTSYHEIYKMEAERREDLVCSRRLRSSTGGAPVGSPIKALGRLVRWGGEGKVLSKLLTTLSFGFIHDGIGGKRSR